MTQHCMRPRKVIRGHIIGFGTICFLNHLDSLNYRWKDNDHQRRPSRGISIMSTMWCLSSRIRQSFRKRGIWDWFEPSPKSKRRHTIVKQIFGEIGWPKLVKVSLTMFGTTSRVPSDNTDTDDHENQAIEEFQKQCIADSVIKLYHEQCG